MPLLVLTSRARRDLASIAAFIAEKAGERDPGQRFARQLLDRCASLARLPGRLGRPRPKLGNGFRSIPFKSYVIFFRYAGDSLEIIAILNARQDVDPRFPDDDNH